MHDPKGDEEDDELEGDDLVDQIVEEGEVVFRHSWDSGSPGAGAGTEYVYSWNGKFAVWSADFGKSGPYASLDEALEEHNELLMVSPATESIDSALLTAKEIARRLYCEEDGYVIEINGQPWVYRAEAGEFKRKRVRT
jgi:hypothetical protein